MDMKDIMLKITGRQYDGDKPLDKMEFVTEGKMYERNGATYLVYEESEFSGFPGCKTSLKLTGDRVRMKRIGENMADGTIMEFESGKRFTSTYETPYGEMDMEILNVTYKCKEGMREEFLETIKAEGLDEASRAEAGNIKYDFYFADADPDELFLFEKWRDEEAVKSHNTEPHFKRFGELKAEFVQETVLERYSK